MKSLKMYCISFPFTSCCLPSSFFCDGPCGPCGGGPCCGSPCGPCGGGSCCLAPCGPCCSPCGGPRKVRCEPLSKPIPAVTCRFIFRNAKFNHDMRLRNAGYYD
uniref:Putative ultrahigh sulfur keratin-associated protein n=2 Tax=Aedes albopictus TaxID=7160 RepID=A0A023ECW3_AEDAL